MMLYISARTGGASVREWAAAAEDGIETDLSRVAQVGLGAAIVAVEYWGVTWNAAVLSHLFMVCCPLGSLGSATRML